MWHCIHAFCLSCLSKRKTSDCYFFFCLQNCKGDEPRRRRKGRWGKQEHAFVHDEFFERQELNL